MASWTNDDLARIERAIASGTLTVQYQDKRVTYRSMEELIRVRDLIQKELDGSSSNLTPFGGRRYKLSHDRGL